MRGSTVGLASLMLLPATACVPVEPGPFPAAPGLTALILVDSRKSAVLAANTDDPRAILTSEAEGNEAWRYHAPLETLGIRSGPLIVDTTAGCPLPPPDLRYRFEGGRWQPIAASADLLPLVRQEDLGFSSGAGPLFLDLSCATGACSLPATYAGCRFDFRGSGCGIAPFAGFLGQENLRPTSLLSDCRSVAAAPGASFSSSCQRSGDGGPPEECTVDAYLPAPLPEPDRSSDLRAMINRPTVDLSGLLDQGDRLLVSVIGSERFSCSPDAPAKLVWLDKETLATQSATAAPTCIKRLSPDGDGFAALFLKPGQGENWSFGRFDREGRLKGSVDLPEELFPPGPLVRLSDGSFAFYGLGGPERHSTTRCAADGSEAGLSHVLRVHADFSVTSTVIGRVPGTVHDHLCGVSYTAIAAVGPERLALYEEIANRLEVIDFLPGGAVRLVTVGDTPPVHGHKLVDLVLVGSTLVAGGGGESSAVTIEVEGLGTRLPTTEAVFVVGRRPHVDTLAKIDDRRLVAVLRPEETDADTRVQLLELEPARRFIPDGLALGTGDLRSIVIDPRNGDVFGALRDQGIVFRARGFAH